MSIELLSVLSAVVAIALGWTIVRGRFAKPELWAVASLIIHLAAANLLNRGVLLDRLNASTATMIAMAAGLVAVTLASLAVRWHSGARDSESGHRG